MVQAHFKTWLEYILARVWIILGFKDWCWTSKTLTYLWEDSNFISCQQKLMSAFAAIVLVFVPYCRVCRQLTNLNQEHTCSTPYKDRQSPKKFVHIICFAYCIGPCTKSNFVDRYCNKVLILFECRMHHNACLRFLKIQCCFDWCQVFCVIEVLRLPVVC